MRISAKPTVLAALALAASFGAKGDDGPTGQQTGFEVEASWGQMDGPGGFQPVGRFRRTPDYRSGDRAQLDVAWWFHPAWSVNAGLSRGWMAYETPVDPVCPLSLTVLLGPPPNAVGCPLGHPTPLVGNIEDRTLTWRLGLGFRHAIVDSVELEASLGFARMEWRTNEDPEARAMADCIAIGQSSTPVLREDCNKVASTASRDGLTGNVSLSWSPISRLDLRLGWHAQKFRYHVYRNEVVPRVVAANCNFPDCGFGVLGLRVVPIEDGSWSWLGARATWQLNEQWAVFVNHEDGGSRPWQTTDVGLRLRF